MPVENQHLLPTLVIRQDNAEMCSTSENGDQVNYERWGVAADSRLMPRNHVKCVAQILILRVQATALAGNRYND